MNLAEDFDDVDVVTDLEGQYSLEDLATQEPPDLEVAFQRVEQALCSLRDSSEARDVISGVSGAALVAGLVETNPRMDRRSLLGLFVAAPVALAAGSVLAAPPNRERSNSPELVKLEKSLKKILEELRKFKEKYSQISQERLSHLTFDEFEKTHFSVEKTTKDIQALLDGFVSEVEGLSLDSSISEEELEQFARSHALPFERDAESLLQFVAELNSRLLGGYDRFLGEVRDENFEQKVLRNPGQSILQVSADWCGPCKYASRFLATYANRSKGAVPVNRVSLQDIQGRPTNNRVRGVIEGAQVSIESFPTIVLYKDGVPVRFMCRSLRDVAEIGKFLRGQMEVVPREDRDYEPKDRERLLQELLRRDKSKSI